MKSTPRCMAVLGILLVVQMLGWAWIMPPNHDEGWILHAAWLSREGLQPYADYGFTQGPSLPSIYAAAQKVFGQGLVAGRVATVGMALFMVFCVVDSVRRLTSDRIACLVLLLAVLDPYLLAQFCLVKTYAVAALGFAFAIWCRVLSIHNKGWLRDFLMLAGAAALGVSAVGVRLSLLPVFVIWVLSAVQLGRREGAWTGAGALLGVGLAVAPAWDAPLDSWAWNMFGVHVGPWALEGGFQPIRLATQSLGMVVFMGWVVVIWLGIGLWTARTAPAVVDWRGPSGLPLGAMLIAGSLAHLMPGSGHGEYVVVLWPALAVLGGCWAAQSARVRPLVGGCFAGLFLAHWGLSWARIAPVMEVGGPGGQSQAIGKILAKGLAPDERILTFHPLVAVEARRRLVEGLEMGPFSLLQDGDASGWGRLDPSQLLAAVSDPSTGAVVTSERDFLHDAYNQGLDPALVEQLQDALGAAASRRFGAPHPHQSLGQFQEHAELYMNPVAVP